MFNLYINFGIHHVNRKIAKVIMLPEYLHGSYRSLSLSSCLSDLLEKPVADELSNSPEHNKKINKENNSFRKHRRINDNLFKLFEAIEFGFHKGHANTRIFLDAKKEFNQAWYDNQVFSLLVKLTSICLNRKLIRWITNSLYQRKLIIPIK